MFNYSVSMALSYLASIYLQMVQGFSSQTAGFIMVCQPVIMAILAPQMGKLSDRISPFKLSSAGMAVSGLGISVFIFVDENTPIPVIMTALTTILGLLPLAIGFGNGAEMVQPVAVVCIGGLLYATAMTLLVVPVMYRLIGRKHMEKIEAEQLEIVNV